MTDITPLFESVFIEFYWKNRPDALEVFPSKYGVPIWSVENKDEIKKVFEINRELFKQCKFNLDKQQLLIESNIKWLYICRVYTDLELPNLTFWFVTYDKNGRQ